MLALRKRLHRTLKERPGGLVVLLAAEKEVGVAYPDFRVLAKFFELHFEEVVCLLESWSWASVARASDREISYLGLADLNIDTSQFLMVALSLVILAGLLGIFFGGLIGAVHGSHF